MKKNTFIFLLILCVSFSGFTQKDNTAPITKPVTKTRRISGASITFQTRDGKLDGVYKSWYFNGEKKSEGSMVDNHRLGKWTFWDSTGKMVCQRMYMNMFNFTRILPAPPDEATITLLNVPVYTLKYNKKNFIDYYSINERAVVWTKRLWRFIPEKNNPGIFTKNKLYTCLMKNINEKLITAYKASDDEFKEELPAEEIKTTKIRIIGYRIKEDFFVDNERLVSEARIQGLCPVALDSASNDTVDLFWVYYPEIRQHLAKAKFKSKDETVPENIQHLDDLFFFRHFANTIYMEANAKDLKISDYKKPSEIPAEAERIELGLIESENDFILSLTK